VLALSSDVSASLSASAHNLGFIVDSRASLTKFLLSLVHASITEIAVASALFLTLIQSALLTHCKLEA